MATNFTPLNGETIIYDEDDNHNYKRIKIGNGIDNVNNLPFTIDNAQNRIDENLETESKSVVGAINELNNKIGTGSGNTTDSLILMDKVTNLPYVIEIYDGQIVSFKYKYIEITQQPDKIDYMSDEELDPTGMIVTLFTHGKESKDITNLITYSNELKSNMVISYIEEDKVYNAILNLNITNMNDVLVDFEFIKNDDGTYTISDWKETLNGENSTKLIVPSKNIIKL